MMEATKDAQEQKEPSDTAKSRTKLSPELQKFYSHHNVVGIEEFLSDDNTASALRFIRLNPRFDKEETLSMLQSELQRSFIPSPVPWLDHSLGFYAVPGDFALAQSSLFRSGRIYGMDVSSGAAVAVLLSDRHDCRSKKGQTSQRADSSRLDCKDDFRVLDLCCCPGLKLCMIADVTSRGGRHENQSTSVVGVDVSEKRLALCKNIVKKYHVDPDTSGHSTTNDSPRIRLYCEDGTAFGTRSVEKKLVFDSDVAREEILHAGKRKRMNKSARARERKRLRQLAAVDMTPLQAEATSARAEDTGGSGATDGITFMRLFDRVLVDAECSTDGSLKHVQKSIAKKAAQTTETTTVNDNLHLADSALVTNSKLTNSCELEELVDLQRGLIDSGLRLLKPGGVMVYSTCSLSQDQNENVVSWLLAKYPQDATLVPVAFSVGSEGQKGMISEGSLPGTVRFLPGAIQSGDEATSNRALYGGGFFLAKLRKSSSATKGNLAITVP